MEGHQISMQKEKVNIPTSNAQSARNILHTSYFEKANLLATSLKDQFPSSARDAQISNNAAIDCIPINDNDFGRTM